MSRSLGPFANGEGEEADGLAGAGMTSLMPSTVVVMSPLLVDVVAEVCWPALVAVAAASPSQCPKR